MRVSTHPSLFLFPRYHFHWMDANMSEYSELYNSVKAKLAKLEPEVEGLRKTLQGLEILMRLETGEPVGNNQQSKIYTDGTMHTISRGAFDNMTLKEAILQLLSLYNGKPLRTKDIATAIETAGYKHGSKNFWNTVNTTLNRMKDIDGTATRDVEGKWIITDKGRDILRRKPMLFNHA